MQAVPGAAELWRPLRRGPERTAAQRGPRHHQGRGGPRRPGPQAGGGPAGGPGLAPPGGKPPTAVSWEGGFFYFSFWESAIFIFFFPPIVRLLSVPTYLTCLTPSTTSSPGRPILARVSERGDSVLSHPARGSAGRTAATGAHRPRTHLRRLTLMPHSGAGPRASTWAGPHCPLGSGRASPTPPFLGGGVLSRG